MRNTIIILIISVLLGNGASAQEEATSWEWAHSGQMTALGRQYFTQPPGSNYQQQGEVATLQTLRLESGTRWQAQLTAQGVLNNHHAHRQRAWVNEAYLAYRHQAWYVKAGKQIVKWGKLSGWSALDLANRYDYYDFLATDEEQLGMWGLTTRLTQGATVASLSVFPGQDRSRLALTDNRWLNLPQALPHPAQPEVMVPLRQTEISSSRSSNVPQIGWEVSTEVSRFTARIGGYYGQNDIPRSRIQLNSFDLQEATYTLDMKYHPILINTFNLSTYLGEWNVWMEAANVNSKRLANNEARLTDDHYGFLALGTDRLWFFNNPERQLKLLVQYVHAISDKNITYAASELDHVFRKSVLLDVNLRVNYKWAFVLRTVNDWATNGHYLRPGIDFRAHDNFQVRFNADFMLGKPEGFFGLFQNNSRLVIFCKYYLL
jgi:hypothetical protein